MEMMDFVAAMPLFAMSTLRITRLPPCAATYLAIASVAVVSALDSAGAETAARAETSRPSGSAAARGSGARAFARAAPGAAAWCPTEPRSPRTARGARTRIERERSSRVSKGWREETRFRVARDARRRAGIAREHQAVLTPIGSFNPRCPVRARSVGATDEMDVQTAGKRSGKRAVRCDAGVVRTSGAAERAASGGVRRDVRSAGLGPRRGSTQRLHVDALSAAAGANNNRDGESVSAPRSRV